MPALAFAVIFFAIIFSATTVFADSVSVNFEDPPYTLGNINGQDGWSKTNPSFDVEVDDSMGTTGFGAQSLRFSNAFTTGSFGDQTFSKSLSDEAGEVDAVNGGLSGGTRQNHFEGEFDFTSTQSTQQPGLFLSVSPDRGDGARMSYLGFSDEAGGIDVIFYDVQGENAGFQAANFVGTTVATGLSRDDVHTAKFVIDFVDGPSNDVVEIYIDGVLVHTGTTWENYFRFDTESQGNPHDVGLENKSRTVDSLLFRAGGASAPGTSGAGFLIDNLELTSSTPPPPPAPVARNINSSSITMNIANRGSINNTTQADSHTGQNIALGSIGGLGGFGGSVTSGAGDENNGGAQAGNGGNGGSSGAGGLVTTGNASADANTINEANSTGVDIGSECGCGGEINGLTLGVSIDNDAPIINTTQGRARTGQNLSLGSAGGNGGVGGNVGGGAGDENNGGASAGTGGSGGTGGPGGAVGTGNAGSTSSTLNLLNNTLIRVRF